MMRLSHTRRPGLSLTEVLVAAFVMGLGIISLMTLFPFGAMQMAQALRDDRSRQTVSQADGMVRIWWQTQVVERTDYKTGTLATVNPPTTATLTMTPGHGFIVGQKVEVTFALGKRIGATVSNVNVNNIDVVGGAGDLFTATPLNSAVSVKLSEDDFWLALDNPGGTLPSKIPAFPAAYDNNPSHPVFLDPIGWHSRPIGQREWISSSPDPRIARRSVSLITNVIPQAVRSCSMMDDITFTQAGVPDTLSGTVTPNAVVREGAFNWAAVIQRPVNSNRYTADLKILVFHTKGLYGGHIPGLNQPGAEQIFPPISATAGSTQVVLPPAAASLIRSGSWIMDGTFSTVTNTSVANFYRVQSITDNVANIILELDSPLKPVPGGVATSQIYILKGLADVFDRPQLTSSGYQRQAP